MLKQYYCDRCNVAQAIEEEKLDGVPFCGVMYELDTGYEPIYCSGKMIEYKTSEFPGNLEIINLVAQLTTKLTLQKMETDNLQETLATTQNTLRQTTKELQTERARNRHYERVSGEKNKYIEHLELKGDENAKEITMPGDEPQVERMADDERRADEEQDGGD